MGIHNVILSTVPALSAACTWVALSFTETFSEPISLLDKFGGSVGSGVVMFLVIRWLLKDKTRLENKVDQLHKERIDQNNAQHAASQKQLDEIKEMLKGKT